MRKHLREDTRSAALQCDADSENRMEGTMIATQSELKALFDDQAEVIRTKDVDRLMSLYSPDVLYFDVVPPLRYSGTAALRGRFQQWFDAFKGSLRVETRDFNISASGDVAVAHWLSRVSGTLKNGHEAGFWVRATSCCQRSNDRWLITHEHISLPVDVMSGRAATDLMP
jgi:ketosteroid isomerase-like protein